MKEDVLEARKLVAEFMGYKVKVVSDTSMSAIPTYNLYIKDGKKTSGYYPDNDWNELMPVVEKISKIEIKDCPVICNVEDTFYDSYYPRTFGMIASESKEFMFRINRFSLHCSTSLIEAAFESVVEFIKYYNQTILN